LRSPTLNPPASVGVGLKSSSRSSGVPLSSVTATLAIGSLPGFVTLYVQVTVLPTGTIGPVGVSLSVPLVSLTI
jgi:hypothetical protein